MNEYMQSVFLANVCWLLHILFVMWIVIVPFTQNEPMLVLHLMIMPFLWFHWILNDDTCALTLMERHLRGVSSEDSFFHNLVSPMYKIQDNDIRKGAWVISIILWMITLSKVMQRPAMIRDVFLGRRHVIPE
jgi:hypothetical protein